MNVYVVETARRMAQRGVEVEIFTRATSSDLPPVAELAPGVLVRHVIAGPYGGLGKEDLPSQLCAFTAGVLRDEARHEPGWYDVVHSHYWLSGQVGWLLRDRWGVPLVHTAHTLAKVKNASLADGDRPEPLSRVVGEEQVVAEADRLVTSTQAEADDLVAAYGADPARVRTIAPGVDLRTFTPAPDRDAARAALGIRPQDTAMAFVGRIQPLKAPDVLLRAAATMLARRPELRERLVVLVVGGPSGTGLAEPESLVALARELGIADVVRFLPPRARRRARAGLPRRRRRRGAQLLGVLRSRRPRGAGLRHAGGGRRRGRAAHRGRPRTLGAAGRRPRPRALGRRPRARRPRPGRAPAVLRRRRRARGDVLVGPHGRRAARDVRRGLAGDGPRPDTRDGGVSSPAPDELEKVLVDALDERELTYTRPGPGRFFVTLPGTKKLATHCWLVLTPHALLVEAFVCRHADENLEEVYRFLLQRNARLYGVHYTIDRAGDIHLVGRVARHAVIDEEIDRILGQVLEAADGDFNTLLELGLRHVDPPRVGVAGVAGGVAGEPLGVRAPGGGPRLSRRATPPAWDGGHPTPAAGVQGARTGERAHVSHASAEPWGRIGFSRSLSHHARRGARRRRTAERVTTGAVDCAPDHREIMRES